MIMMDETFLNLLRERQQQLQREQQQSHGQQASASEHLRQRLVGAGSSNPVTLSAASLGSLRRSPDLSAVSASGLDLLTSPSPSHRRGSGLLPPAASYSNPFGAAMHPSSTSARAVAESDLSSFAISREIKRLQELQQQMAATSSVSNNPFLYTSQAALSSAAPAMDPNSVLLQQILMQKAQSARFQQPSTSSVLGASLAANAGLPRIATDHASSSLLNPSGFLESQLLQEARLLMRRKSMPTSFAAAAAAKSPAPPFPSAPAPPMSTEGSRKMRGGVIEPFPEKLNRLLAEVEQVGRTDIISWVNNGKAFMIHNSEEFFKDIVPLYFRQSRLSSFKRQLNLYGFELINSGPARGAYYHELFQRDQPDLCRRMRRVAVKVAGKPPSSVATTSFAGASDKLEEKGKEGFNNSDAESEEQDYTNEDANEGGKKIAARKEQAKKDS